MQTQQNELKCEGCGQQFSNQNDLQKHRTNCSAVKAKGQQQTHSAGGGQNRQG